MSLREDAWLITSLVLFTTGHWIGGIIALGLGIIAVYGDFNT